MKLKYKVFLLILVGFTSLILGLTGIFAHQFGRHLEREFNSRQSGLMSQLGINLVEIEKTVDIITASAVHFLQSEVSLKGVPDNQTLAKMAKDLGVTHLYVTDSTGKFIRSTDYTLDQLGSTGLFDFCSEYRNLLADHRLAEKTPILPSFPYTGAYKFYMRASRDGKNVLEAGMHLTFVSSILQSTLENDTTIQRVGIYTPSGQMLGEINRDKKVAAGPAIDIPSSVGEPIKDRAGMLTFFKKVPSGTQNCCECKVKNITEGGSGEYFYWIAATVDPSSLAAAIKEGRSKIFLLGLSVLLVFIVIGWFMGDRIAHRFLSLESQVGEIIKTKNFKRRVSLEGRDEIASTAGSINHLLETVEQSNKEALAAAEHKNLATVARRIAHDLRSPIAALNAAVRMQNLSSEVRNEFVVESLNRISAMAKGLARGEISGPKLNLGSTPVSDAICRVFETKKLECADRTAEWALNVPQGLEDKMLPGTGDEWFRVISNLVNNALESVDQSTKPRIELSVAVDGARANIQLVDNGQGMSSETLARIGEEGFSVGKEGSADSGAGVGVASSRDLLSTWGGTLTYRSVQGMGTTAVISVPLG
jgi:signal transduction histidine kinase